MSKWERRKHLSEPAFRLCALKCAYGGSWEVTQFLQVYPDPSKPILSLSLSLWTSNRATTAFIKMKAVFSRERQRGDVKGLGMGGFGHYSTLLHVMREPGHDLAPNQSTLVSPWDKTGKMLVQYIQSSESWIHLHWEDSSHAAVLFQSLVCLQVVSDNLDITRLPWM